MDNEGADRMEEMKRSMAQLQALREDERFNTRVRIEELREVYSTRMVAVAVLGFAVGFVVRMWLF